MVAKAEKSRGMSYGEIKAYIQIGPKAQYNGRSCSHLPTFNGKGSTTISLRESKAAS